MADSPRMLRTRTELSEFLRSRRERLEPGDVGLPQGSRRRTPGLRREEVASLAGVGLTWYTWLEQGREISVSATFLDSLCRVLKLDAAERRYLYLLTQQRPPAAPGKTWCVVPPLIHRMMADLTFSPCYVLNLRWDVLAWNSAADALFHFSRWAPGERNLLRMLFVDPLMHSLLSPWDKQALQMLCEFRRSFVRATKEPDITALINELTRVSPEFKSAWQQQDIHGPNAELHHFNIEPLGTLALEHTRLTIDEDRHLQLNYYAVQKEHGCESAFQQWLKERC